MPEYAENPGGYYSFDLTALQRNSFVSGISLLQLRALPCIVISYGIELSPECRGAHLLYVLRRGVVWRREARNLGIQL